MHYICSVYISKKQDPRFSCYRNWFIEFTIYALTAITKDIVSGYRIRITYKDLVFYLACYVINGKLFGDRQLLWELSNFVGFLTVMAVL